MSSLCEIDSRSAKHANTLSAGSKVFNEPATHSVHEFCADTECVLIYRYECGVECLSSAHVESLTIGV